MLLVEFWEAPFIFEFPLAFNLRFANTLRSFKYFKMGALKIGGEFERKGKINLSIQQDGRASILNVTTNNVILPWNIFDEASFQ